MDDATRGAIRLKKRLAHQAESASDFPPGRQANITEDEAFFCDGVRIQFLGHSAFSLWRSIEMNVVQRVRALFVDPILDIGCGDGAFFSLAIGTAKMGIDVLDDLEGTVRPGVYETVLNRDITVNTGLEPGSFSTVFANSVMEHVPDLDAALGEISRLLVPGGRFIATVPMSYFLDGLEQWHGKRRARELHAVCSHCNLLSSEQWVDRLRRAGLDTELIHRYMSPEAGRAFAVLSGSFVRNVEVRTGRLVWNWSRRRIARMVVSSLDSPEGYCGMIVARKP